MASGSKMTRRLVLNFIFVLLVSVLYEAYGASIPRNDDWHIAGPYGGSATAVAIDPKNSKILLAGARQSLLYKTDDGGTLWSMLPFPKRTFGEVGAILIDRLDPQHYLV